MRQIRIRLDVYDSSLEDFASYHLNQPELDHDGVSELESTLETKRIDFNNGPILSSSSRSLNT